MAAECEAATRQKAAAFWLGDGVLITASGETPESCWDVTIEKSLLTVWPPEFALVQCRTQGLCLEVMTPFTVSEFFNMNERPNSVVLHWRDGHDDLTVEDIPTQQLVPFGPADAGREVAGPDVDEAVGMSRRMSFDDAFADAINRLPRWTASHPDEMSVVAVVEIGAWYGGIAGFNHLVVRVRRRKSRIS
jgi:hypothetical protein